MTKYHKKRLDKQERRPHRPRFDSQAKPANTDFVLSAVTDAFGVKALGWREWGNFRDASPTEIAQRRATMESRRFKKKRRSIRTEKQIEGLFGVAS